MPWPRSERGSPVPKPKARSPVLCGLALALPPAAVTEAGCEPPTPVITAVAACPMAVARAFDNAPMFTVTMRGGHFLAADARSILAGNENGFRLGNGTTSLRSGPRHVGPRFDPLPPGVYISLAVFIYP